MAGRTIYIVQYVLLQDNNTRVTIIASGRNVDVEHELQCFCWRLSLAYFAG